MKLTRLMVVIASILGAEISELLGIELLLDVVHIIILFIKTLKKKMKKRIRNGNKIKK